jgi:Orsellinic acid/F9775 biosynthesis cluster protein D
MSVLPAVPETCDLASHTTSVAPVVSDTRDRSPPATSVPSVVPTIPAEFRSLLRYEEKYQTLICKPCGRGLSMNGFHRHLQSKHNVGHKDRNAILRSISSSSCIAEWDQFPIPLNGSRPIQDLQIISGFGCNFCDMLSQNRTVITTHIYNVHKGESRSKGCRSVSLQTWFHGTRQTYWTVVDPNDSFLPPSLSKSLSLSKVANENTAIDGEEETLTWEEQVIKMEETRLEKQNKYQFELEARHHADDITPWLLRVKWPQLFSGKNLELIGETRQLRTENAQVLTIYGRLWSLQIGGAPA